MVSKGKHQTNKLIWDDWRSQMRHAISSIEHLKLWINVTPQEEAAILACQTRYQWQITPYYASLMDKDDPACPIRKQAIPDLLELENYPHASLDPVGDTTHRKTRRVIHKYPDRAIILVTDTCSTYCRHCTRKYHTTDINGTYFGDRNSNWEHDFEYIQNNPQIRDILLTGGDPLSISNQGLEKILIRLRQIPHVEIIRIGSRFPVVLPQRITNGFCRMLEKYHPIWFSTQFNHPKEITDQSAEACNQLLRHGIPVQNQSVLLKGINDSPDVMRKLMTELVRIRVRPYYLYHCDNAIGVSHFATTLQAGWEIMNSLSGFITGFAVPEYVLTTPLGKINLARERLFLKDGTYWVINYNGEKMNVQDLLLC